MRTLQGEYGKTKQEHKRQMVKLAWILSPVVIVSLLLLVAYLLGSTP